MTGRVTDNSVIDDTKQLAAVAARSWKEFLAWWMEGLLQCLPQHLRPGRSPARRYVLRMEGENAFVLYSHAGNGMEKLAELESPRTFPLEQWIGKAGGDAPLTLRVPESAVLVRRIMLPLAAGANLAQVLRYEMDRFTPFAEAEVFFDYRVVAKEPDRARMQVEVAVLKKALLEEPLAGLAASGHTPQVIDTNSLWPAGNLLPVEMRGRRGRAGVRGWLLAGSIALLGLAVVFTPLWQQRQVVVELGERLHKVRGQAEAVMELQEQLDRRSQVAEYLSSRQRQRAAVVDILRELTERLPDDTWLQQLSIRGSNIEIHGESTQATQLIELLENSPRFKSVAFRSSLTQVRTTDIERFAIVMTLTGGADGE